MPRHTNGARKAGVVRGEEIAYTLVVTFGPITGIPEKTVMSLIDVLLSDSTAGLTPRYCYNEDGELDEIVFMSIHEDDLDYANTVIIPIVDKVPGFKREDRGG